MAESLRPISMASGNSLALAYNTPLPEDSDSFREPRIPFLSNPGEALDSPRDSFLQSIPNDSGTLLAIKTEEYGAKSNPPPRGPRRRLCSVFLIVLLILAVVVLAVVLPVYFVVIKPKNRSTAASSPSSADSTGIPTGTLTSGKGKPTSVSAAAITGGDGSTITASDGTTFTYNNVFGGIWWSDPQDPYSNNAYPNSWTPPLNQSWNYGTDRIYGVNLGGWFVLEPFITPDLFQKYPAATDEWSLSTLMAADTASGGLSQIETHYQTFITEQDFAQIAAAGLNWIRLPIPFWAIDKWGNEPFLAKTSWKYIVQAFNWARKYGLRVKLDLHTIPGSQNGYNHSGKDGQVDFLRGAMGLANAQRAMNYIRILTEFISQPAYRDVVPVFGIVNEALISTIGTTQLRGFYLEAYKMIRGITGVGAGNGPYISIHDGFQGLSLWAGFLDGSDRVILDTHPYFAFNGESNTAPIDTGVGPGAGGTWPQKACNSWASEMNTSRSAFGVTIAGEWSNGFNDCGLFLNGIPGGHNYGGDCSIWQDSRNWSAGTKAGIMAFASSSMDALRDWFFWTWKVGNSTAGIVESPLWSYQLGWQQGWIPTDPRSAIGSCGASDGPIFASFDTWMTGGAGAGTVAASQSVLYPYPPSTLADGTVDATSLPVYTSIGSIVTLPMPTFTNAGGQMIVNGNGWFNPNDNQPGPTPITGCSYPDPWDALSAAIPIGCTAAPTAAVPAAITPPPQQH